MENRKINNYKELNNWFLSKDFSIDTYISIELRKSKLLKIKKIDYLYEKDTYIEKIFPVELTDCKVLLDDKEIYLFEGNMTVKDILVIDAERPSLHITFYNSTNVLSVISETFIFHDSYEIPYTPPLRINKNRIRIKIQVGLFDYPVIIKKFRDVNIEISLRGYFGDKVDLSEIKNVEDLLGLSIFQDSPRENSFQDSLGINFCNMEKEDDYIYITFDLQNTKLNIFWIEFIKILLSMNLLEIKSGNVTFSKNEFDLFKKDFSI